MCLFVHCSRFLFSGIKSRNLAWWSCFKDLYFFSVFFLVFILESLSLSCVCSKTFNYSWVLFCCWKSRIRVRNREKNLVSESFFLLSIDFSNETQIIIIIKKKTVERKRALSWKKIVMDHLEFQWKKTQNSFQNRMFPVLTRSKN